MLALCAIQEPELQQPWKLGGGLATSALYLAFALESVEFNSFGYQSVRHVHSPLKKRFDIGGVLMVLPNDEETRVPHNFVRGLATHGVISAAAIKTNPAFWG